MVTDSSILSADAATAADTVQVEFPPHAQVAMLEAPLRSKPLQQRHLVAEVLGRDGISIEAVIQRPEAVRQENGESWVPIVILTNHVRESAVEAAKRSLTESDHVHGEIRTIRVADVA